MKYKEKNPIHYVFQESKICHKLIRYTIDK